MINNSIFILSLSFLFTISCTQPQEFDISMETEKILDLHKAQRDYHFNKDSIAFANQLSENFIGVGRGEITRPTKEATIARYNNYFSSVEFLEWDDVNEPIIKFSDDGSLAYTIVEKIVRLTSEDGEGNPIESKTHFAWTAIYKKYGEDWKIDNVTSTNKPEEN